MNQEIAMQHAMMIEVAIERGNLDMGLRIVDRAFDVAESERRKIKPTDDIVAILPIRLANLLKEQGIRTVGDLTECSKSDLLRVPLISQVRAGAIVKALGKVGLKLANPVVRKKL